MSIFAPWRGFASQRGDGHSDDDVAKGQTKDYDDDDGPLTAPGGWGSLLTWRPVRSGEGGGGVVGEGRRQSGRFYTSKGDALHLADDGVSDKFSTTSERFGREDAYVEDNGDETNESISVIDSPERNERLYTARTRLRAAPSRPRAPIPFRRDPSPAKPPSTDATAPSSSSSSFVQPESSLNAFKGADSADVSAELMAEASGDLSIDVGALDSAFETLTRIKAKDVAALSATSVAAGAALASSVPTGRRVVSSTSTNATASRKPSFSFYTPNDSPTQLQHPSPSAMSNNTWLQWGTSKIRATMPRGIASALFAAIGEQGDVKGGERLEEEEYEVDEDGTALLVRDCVDVICGHGTYPGLLDVEGLFRVPPANILLKSTKEAYARGQKVNLAALTEQDRHLPAALLKDYLRSMQPPLIPETLYDAISACPQNDEKAIGFVQTTLLPALGRTGVKIVERVLRCAHEVLKHHKENKMNANNLAVVLTPNFVHGSDVLRDMAMCFVPKGETKGHGETVCGANERNEMTLGRLIQLCIERCDDVFEGFLEDDSGDAKAHLSATNASSASPWTTASVIPLTPICTVGGGSTSDS